MAKCLRCGAGNEWIEGRVTTDEEGQRWLDIKLRAVEAAVDDDVTDEQLGRHLRALMNLPDSPPFTGPTGAKE